MRWYRAIYGQVPVKSREPELIALRKDTEAKLGSKFNQLRFHGFLLGQGLLTPDLMSRAVAEEFVPRERAQR